MGIHIPKSGQTVLTLTDGRNLVYWSHTPKSMTDIVIGSGSGYYLHGSEGEHPIIKHTNSIKAIYE